MGDYDPDKRATYDRLKALNRKNVTGVEQKHGRLVIRFREGEKEKKLVVPLR